MWEEVVHTITEAVNRNYPQDFGFSSNSYLGQELNKDRNAQGNILQYRGGSSQSSWCWEGTNDCFGYNTAVNEWLYLVWKWRNAGFRLTEPQSNAAARLTKYGIRPRLTLTELQSTKVLGTGGGVNGESEKESTIGGFSGVAIAACCVVGALLIGGVVIYSGVFTKK